jgi:hypothetical protein
MHMRRCLPSQNGAPLVDLILFSADADKAVYLLISFVKSENT